MAYLKIGTTDISNYISGLKIGYETLTSSDSGRNANGDTVIDIINHKVKIFANFRSMTQTEMNQFLTAISSYVVSVTYLDAKTNTLITKTCYTGTPEPEYLYIWENDIRYKPFSVNFIEL